MPERFAVAATSRTPSCPSARAHHFCSGVSDLMNAQPLTVGDLDPQDDYMHPVSADPSHNESMFFNFFDARQRIGGFVRIGNRINEKHAEMTLCLFLPNGEVLLQWAKPAID